MSHLRGFPDLPPIWALGVYLLQQALAAWLPIVPLGEWAVPVGRVFIALGLGLILWAAFWFARKRTAIEPRHVPSALIVEGPYRLNRNPIYTGLAVVLVGTGLTAGALASVLAAGLFPWIVGRRFVRDEEEGLRRAFGVEAEAYIAATRRW